MSQKTFISLLATFILATVSLADAQPKKVSLIGYLSDLDATRESGRAEAIRLALRERGHIEG